MSQEVTVALIGIVPAVLTALLGFWGGKKTSDRSKAKSELRSRRFKLQVSSNPSFRELSYPNYGISLLVPVSWTTEDGPAIYAGGEFNLVHRYEETKGAIGINFRLRPVQPNYINDPQTQVANMYDALVASFGSAKVNDISISGLTGKVFEYENPTGKRRMLVKLYWIRLVPSVQLQIFCGQYTDATDSEDFWRSTDFVLSSTVIAFDTWQARYRKNLTSTSS